jgi:hypothetical protein
VAVLEQTFWAGNTAASFDFRIDRPWLQAFSHISYQSPAFDCDSFMTYAVTAAVLDHY